MKVALVHDDFMQWGGAERVVAAMAEIWPEAPIYTLAYDPSILPADFPVERLCASRLNTKFYKKWLYPKLFFLDPIVFERFNLNEFDVVVSSTSRFAKSVVTQPQTKHFAYINTPPRFLWPVSQGFDPDDYLSGFVNKTFFPFRPLVRMVLPMILSNLRLLDVAGAQRIDFLVANSANVARRIKKFYHREANVVHPFVDLERFDDVAPFQTSGDYFLIVSRLSDHKRIDLAIEAFNELGWKLKVIGTGPERENLERLAQKNIEFLGYVSDEEVVHYLAGCKAFIYPQEEDFGITALEAQAVGRPVIAYRGGGVLETVIEGETGVFFDAQTKDSLIHALKEFETNSFDSQKIRNQVRKFSREQFKQTLKEFVDTKYQT